MNLARTDIANTRLVIDTLPVVRVLKIPIIAMTIKESFIAKPLTLKCGLTLPNHLVKAAIAEQMAVKEGLPHAAIMTDMLACMKPWNVGIKTY